MKECFAFLRSGLGCVVFLLVLPTSEFRIAAAAEGVAGPQVKQLTKPAEVCIVSLASLSELSNAAKTIGIDLPPLLTARGIEEKIPFLRGHGLDATQPLCVLLFMRPGWDLSHGQGVAIALPVNPETATVDWFGKIGCEAVADHPDTFNLQGTTFRRTKNHLILAIPQDAAAAVDPAELANSFKAGSGSLAHASLNVSAMRTDSTEQFRAFFNLPKKDSDGPVERLGRESVSQWWQTVNRVDMQLRCVDNAVRAKLTFDPLTIPSPKQEFPMPAMPADVMLRIDLARAPAGLDGVTQHLMDVDSSDDKPASPKEAAARANLSHERTELLFGGKAWSMGFSPHPRAVPAYIVEQQVQRSARDQIQRFADRYNALNQLLDRAQRGVAKVESYTDGGLKVTRLKVIANDREETYVDAVKRAHNLYLTFSHDPGRYLKSLVGRAPEGKMAGAMSMRINMDRAMEAVVKMPDGNFKDLPAEGREQLARILKGQTIGFTIQGEGDRATFEMSLSQTLLKRIGEATVGQ
jgi:hypothetical protein